MSTRFLLRFTLPSHALAAATWWTRVLVETESANGRGHLIGSDMILRKDVNEWNQVVRIEVERFGEDWRREEAYLAASAWWLHRPPFTVTTLPVSLIMHKSFLAFEPHKSWRVTSIRCVNARYERSVSRAPALGAWFPQLYELALIDSHVLFYSFIPSCACLEKLTLNDATLSDLSLISHLALLREVDISGTPVKDLNFLRKATSLVVVNAFNCRALRDITALEKLPRLREVRIDFSCVTDLQPLSGHVALEVFTASYCVNLTSIAALNTSPHLRELNISESGVTSLSPISQHTQLEVVRASRCEQLHDVSPVQASKALRVLDIHGLTLSQGRGSDLHFVAGFSQLQELRVSRCGAAFDLEWAAPSAYSLQTLHVTALEVTHFDALRTMTRLQDLNIAECAGFHDLSLVENAVALRELDVRGTHVVDLSPLRHLTAITRLDVSCNGGVTDIAALSALDRLETLILSNTGVSDVQPLQGLARLRLLSANSCPRLADLTPLKANTSLVQLELHHTAVSDLHFASGLRKLNYLAVSQCPEVKDVSPLTTCVALRQLYLSGTAVTRKNADCLKPNALLCICGLPVVQTNTGPPPPPCKRPAPR